MENEGEIIKALLGRYGDITLSGITDQTNDILLKLLNKTEQFRNEVLDEINSRSRQR